MGMPEHMRRPEDTLKGSFSPSDPGRLKRQQMLYPLSSFQVPFL